MRLALAIAFAAAPAAAELPTTALTLHPPHAEPRTLTVEIAHTPAAREKGLSNRATLAANAGMLFLFPTPRRACMWMKDTQIPLVAAFINESGIVTQTAAMRPHTTTRHCAQAAAVLETTPNTAPPLHTRTEYAPPNTDDSPR